MNQKLTHLNDIKQNILSQIVHADEINVPTTLGIDANGSYYARSYNEWHGAGSGYRRFIMRKNQVHCVLKYTCGRHAAANVRL